MSGNGNSTLSLLCSAFGPFSTPYTVLQCNDLSTPAELRCAYRAAALRYHPDRLLLCPRDDDDNGSEGEGEVSRCTLKFQAVSAAYRVLMDEGRRSHYDRTGEVREDGDDDDDDGNNHDGPLPPPSKEEERHPLEER